MGKNIQQINTAKVEPAVEVVGPSFHTAIGIESIEFIGEEDVYNLEVEKYHNFSIQDGLIVHNCIDSLRYSLERDNIKKKISGKPLGW